MAFSAFRDRTVFVFYGSATGNSEFIAKRIHTDCQARCVGVMGVGWVYACVCAK
jgi:hypothetical protein